MMLTTEDKIQLSFNKASISYDTHCHPQLAAGHCLIQLLKQLRTTFPAFIDLGCGSGILTEKLAQTISWETAHAIDTADQLLSIAEERLNPLGISTYLADFQRPLPQSMQFDLVFSNLALHWSTDVNTLFQQLGLLVNDQGLLAFSIPLAGTFANLQPFFSLQEFNTANTIATLLTEYGFTLESYQEQSLTYSFDSTLAALQSIKKVGANHCRQRKPGLSGKSLITKANINELTYIIGHFIAKKVASS